MNLIDGYEVIARGKISVLSVSDSPLENRILENQARIEKIWQDALKENRKLFNDKLLSFLGFKDDGGNIRVNGSFVEYKDFLAQKSGLGLGIKPIGVSGVVVVREQDEEYVLFARRSKNVTLYSGFLELVPSGGIDGKYIRPNGEVDYKAQLLTEFCEETGLPESCVKEISELCLMLDSKDNVYDVCCRIDAEAQREVFMEGFRSKEYESPVFVKMRELRAFIEKNRDLMVPTSVGIVEELFRTG
ncbi:hypothetical protein CMI47_15250 [Candidatus Pacearchaeota archaeon]|nr:hypothetical protein [Candidatus Pacearchaeota archaeon]